jgi:vacuolar-type H+-ATPase subunit H
MDIVETLKADYARFPVNQTYSIYADDVYFQDAVFKFRGIELYKWMIKFIQTVFLNLKLDLHQIQSQEEIIKTRKEASEILNAAKDDAEKLKAEVLQKTRQEQEKLIQQAKAQIASDNDANLNKSGGRRKKASKKASKKSKKGSRK